MINSFKNNNLVAPSFIIAIGIVLTGIVFAMSANTFANKSDTITVTGSADRLVTSDTAKWSLNVSYRSADLKSGNDAMVANSAAIEKYLLKSGIAIENIRSNNVTSNPVCSLSPQGYESCSLGIVGYNFNQNFIIESDDVNLITKLAKAINSNLSNINLSSNVEYYYNNLKNIRAELLSEATKNALDRAKSVADAGGASIGKITSLSSGVFQVTAKNSVNYDDYGSYDTSEVEKKITATVKANFSVK